MAVEVFSPPGVFPNGQLGQALRHLHQQPLQRRQLQPQLPCCRTVVFAPVDSLANPRQRSLPRGVVRLWPQPWPERISSRLLATS